MPAGARVWAISQGEAGKRTPAANTMIRATKRQGELKFKIANLEVGIFTEPFSIHQADRWIVDKNFNGIHEDIKPAINRPRRMTSEPRFHWSLTAEPWPLLLKVRLRCVVTRPVSHAVRRRLGQPGNCNLDTP